MLPAFTSVHHGHIDPKADGVVGAALGSTKISTSQNTAMLGRAAAQRQEAMRGAAEQQRLYMTVYIMSFLTNTMIALVSDNMGSGPPSDFILLVQAALVTPSGFYIGLVFSRTAKSLSGAYYDTWVSFQSRQNLDAAQVWKHRKEAANKKREMLQARILERKVSKTLSSLVLPLEFCCLRPCLSLSSGCSGRKGKKLGAAGNLVGALWVRQRSSLLKAVITAFPSVSLPFLAVPLLSHRTVAIRCCSTPC
eukprot:SAG22_NODE_422_length_10687_cov_4.448149_4_plen_250_part_00